MITIFSLVKLWRRQRIEVLIRRRRSATDSLGGLGVIGIILGSSSLMIAEALVCDRGDWTLWNQVRGDRNSLTVISDGFERVRYRCPDD